MRPGVEMQQLYKSIVSSTMHCYISFRLINVFDNVLLELGHANMLTPEFAHALSHLSFQILTSLWGQLFFHVPPSYNASFCIIWSNNLQFHIHCDLHRILKISSPMMS